ncbi:YHS domain-containing protein [Fuerstiella marisgermanici]|uniref:YHS domain protein n=1 Tax=Fuerstiella marisgermanici TaxID=1891926 RepID=A0A1P8WJS5_9PLAN|nr:YHS domain-containing protein [Fuerstiella marisgermanici]APZ94312.1 YHS domain protein [Fuerstiella marisgermanici]
MSHSDRPIIRTMFAAFTLVFVATIFISPSAHCQDEGAPKWGKWIREFRRDKLLKKPFHNSPEDEVKGLASKLRARELDIPNRIKAVKYLSRFHCSTFPEARAMLVKVMLEDKWEPVRLEAIQALQAMFEECACKNAEEEDEPSRREKRDALKYGSPDLDSARQCLCCCDEDTLTALAKVAYELDDKGCPFEPSRRVREAAVEAIAVCGIPCCYKPYTAGPEMGPPAWETDEPVQQQQSGGEEIPDETRELNPVPSNDGLLLPEPMTSVTPTAIPRLSKVCLVSLKQGQKLAPKTEFAAQYRGRVYHFASQAALDKFNASPEQYAVAFGGCDPVHFVNTKQVVTGRYLVMHNDKFYMFTSEQNFELFKANSGRFTGQSTDRSQLALASPGR